MQRLMFFLFCALPMVIFGQTNTPIDAAHQQAEANFMARNPHVSKVDLEKLTAEQKDDINTCNTCGQKNNLSTEVTNTVSAEQRLKTLKAEQQRIMDLMKPLLDSRNDDALLQKYRIALVQNVKQIKAIEEEDTHSQWEINNQKAIEQKKSK